MATNVVGSVTAELILDSSNFISGLETAKQQIKGLSGSVGTGGLEAFKKKITETNTETKKLKENLANLGKVQYGNPFAGWVDPVNELITGMEKVNEGLFKQQEKLRLLKDEWLSFKALYNGLLSTKPMDTWIKDIEKATIETKKYSAEVAKLGHVAKVGNSIRNYADPMMTADYNSARQFFERIGMEATKSGEQVANFEKQIIALKNAMSAGRKFTLIDGVGNQLDATSPKIAKIRAELEQLYATMTMNSTRVVSSLGNSVNQTSQQLSNLSNNVTKTSGSFSTMSTTSTNVANSVSKMNGTFGGAVQNVRNMGTAYNTTSGMANKYAESTNKASSSTSKLGASTRTASTSMNKLHGALSSVKMMATALSSMFVWTFGMSLYEATKLTLQSKNEMESYLQQMHMGRGAINLFNQGLDETADRFKKLNKYMIGETIASIGMEFDLTANQMKKSMEVVAMVQNEYVRAGRKESEASLAVKDILQGEFLRLSRETGVGKQDLIDTGLWQGDLKDVEGLMDALKKVGEDRHWDLFASKCLSLNDVISETKNRISEFGASLADQFSPAIVNAFNMIVDSIDAVTNTWENFDPTTKIAVGATAFIAFGTALLMVAGHLSLLDIAQMGYSASLVTTVLKLDVATVKEYGLATAITSKITALEGSTVAEMGNATAIASRLLGLEASVVAEHGLSGALGLSASMKGEDTIATNINALSKDTNVASTLLNAQVVGEFTVVEGLSTVALNQNTTATELNAVIKELKARADLSGFQAIVVYVTGLKAEEVQAMSTNEALLALLGTMTALEAIALAVVIVGIAVTLGSLAMEAQRAKEAVDGFYDVVDNGDAYLDDAKKNVESLEKQYNNLGQSIEEAKAKGEDPWKLEQNQAQTKANLEVAKQNVKDIENVNNLAKKSAEEFNAKIVNANTDFERKNAEIFKKLGKEGNEASEMASQYTQKYLKGMEQMRVATNAYTTELEKGATHIDENTTSLQAMGAENETLIKYAQDYGEEIVKNAQYQKEWAEGDFWAIFKIGLSELKLAWIDFTYWIGQQKWYQDFCNALGEMQNALGDLYHAIQPILPVIGELLGWLASQLWSDFADTCYLIYDAVKLVYPQFREWAGVNYNNIKDLSDALHQIYDILIALDDLRKGDGDKLKEFFENFSDPINFNFTDPNFDGADILDRGGGITQMLPDAHLQLLEMFLPMPTVKQLRDKLNEISKAVDDAIANFFGGGSGDGAKSRGAKHIDGDNFITNFLKDMLPSTDEVTNFVNEQIVQPFTDAINNFVQNPLGAVIGGVLDIGQFLANIFGIGEEFSAFTTFVQEKIALPLQNEINMFISDPFGYMGGMMESFNISSLLNGLFGLGEEGASTFITDFVNNSIIAPFSTALTYGLSTIPIVGDILTMLGLIDTTTGTASQKGWNIGNAFGTAVENFVRNIPIVGDILSWLGLIDGTTGTAHGKGDAVGSNIKTGVDDGKQGTAGLVSDEMGEVISALANAVGEAYAQAQAIGGAIMNGINSMIQHHSPGLPAQLISAEMGEIVLAMANAKDTVFATAQSIGQAIIMGIQPSGEINFDAEAMAQYQANTMMAMGLADETVLTTETAFSDLDYNTMVTFASISNTIGSTMTNISNNTKLNYTNIANTTRTQLNNMQSQTTKNIGAIKQSWAGMQTALIQSAEHIRSETGAKINSLQNNMATFWRKVQNPALLLGAGEPSEERAIKPRRYGSTGSSVRKVLTPKGMYAGSPSSASKSIPHFKTPSAGGFGKNDFPSNINLEELLNNFKSDERFKSVSKFDLLFGYLDCLLEDKGCVAGKGMYAGGWDFNWSEDIKKALLTWHTHFGEVYDPYLYVGKFENDNFPIRGIAPIAKNYIYDAISRTQYEYYWNSKYGDPLSIWNAGHFNCYDGAILVMALARALGFPNSHMVHGTWAGIGHVWAYIEGLGNIDATAIQNHYGLMAPSRTGVGAGAMPRFKHDKAPNFDNGNGNGDIHINIDLSGATVTDDSIGERIGKKVRDEIIDLINPSPSTGY